MESADQGLLADEAIAEADTGFMWVKRFPGPPIMYVMGVIVFAFVPSLCHSMITFKPLNGEA